MVSDINWARNVNEQGKIYTISSYWAAIHSTIQRNRRAIRSMLIVLMRRGEWGGTPPFLAPLLSPWFDPQKTSASDHCAPHVTRKNAPEQRIDLRMGANKLTGESWRERKTPEVNRWNEWPDGKGSDLPVSGQVNIEGRLHQPIFVREKTETKEEIQKQSAKHFGKKTVTSKSVDNNELP